MGSLSDYAEAELLDHICLTAYTPAATIYLALCTAAPTDASTGSTIVETDYTSYARTAISFGAASSRVITQDAIVTFPQAGGNSTSPVTHWAICDASTLGNMLAYGAFASSKSIVTNNTPSVASTEINVTFSASGWSDYAANAALNLMFDNGTFTVSANYVALTDATISDSSTGTSISEPAAGAYARVQVNQNGGSSPTWDLATGTTPTLVDNTHAITFPTATASWGTIVAAAVCDAATNGNMLVYDNSVTDQAVGTDDVVEFAIGAFDITLA